MMKTTHKAMGNIEKGAASLQEAGVREVWRSGKNNLGKHGRSRRVEEREAREEAWVGILALLDDPFLEDNPRALNCY